MDARFVQAAAIAIAANAVPLVIVVLLIVWGR